MRVKKAKKMLGAALGALVAVSVLGAGLSGGVGSAAPGSPGNMATTPGMMTPDAGSKGMQEMMQSHGMAEQCATTMNDPANRESMTKMMNAPGMLEMMKQMKQTGAGSETQTQPSAAGGHSSHHD